jgi:hypothetical protein
VPHLWICISWTIPSAAQCVVVLFLLGSAKISLVAISETEGMRQVFTVTRIIDVQAWGKTTKPDSWLHF